MILRPPRSTLFPYTTSSDLESEVRSVCELARLHAASRMGSRRTLGREREAGGVLLRARHERSEEHTSELQSLTNLVCRLLLEKKKKIIHITLIQQQREQR